MTHTSLVERPRVDADVTVLVVEDDPQVLSMLCDELQRRGFVMRTALSALEVDEAMLDGNVDFVILDLALDGVPYKGLDLVEGIRKRCSVPIVVISAHSQSMDRVRALELGINDYITKPFLIRELELRIHRLLGSYQDRRLNSLDGVSPYLFSGFMLDPVRRVVTSADGGEVVLTETEFDVLEYLLGSAGRIVSRDELWRSLRGQPWSPLDRALDGHVSRLRSKLEPGVERSQIIKSGRGVGYFIAVQVSRKAR